MNVPYQQEISVTNNLPTAVLLLVDLSGSMEQPWGGSTSMSKAEMVSDIVNKAMANACLMCTVGTQIKDYLHVGVITYSGRGPEDLFGTGLTPISQVDTKKQIQMRQKKEYDLGEMVVREVPFSVWLEPQADGGTPMTQAINLAAEWIGAWIQRYPDSYPPTIINITDGQPNAPGSDNDMPAAEQAAQRLLSLSTSDGTIVLANVHISETPGSPIRFPNTDAALPDDFARFLFRISSSPLPPKLLGGGGGKETWNVSIAADARAFIFQSEPEDLINLLKVGTQVKNPAQVGV